MQGSLALGDLCCVGFLEWQFRGWVVSLAIRLAGILIEHAHARGGSISLSICLVDEGQEEFPSIFPFEVKPGFVEHPRWDRHLQSGSRSLLGHYGSGHIGNKEKLLARVLHRRRVLHEIK